MTAGKRDGVGVVVQARGRVSPADHAYAHTKVATVIEHAPDLVPYAKVVLQIHEDPDRACPAVATVELDVNGQIVRAHAAGSTMHVAIDAMQARLRQQLEHFREVRDSRRRRNHEVWHHGDAFLPRPDYFPRPEEEREVLRRKTFSVGAKTPVEAAADLELLDDEFNLFWNTSTDEDAVLHRAGTHRYELIEISPHLEAQSDATIQPSPLRPSAMSERDAIELLTLGDEPFVFYLDPMTHRGRVVYRRYDGHYGLITAVDDPA